MTQLRRARLRLQLRKLSPDAASPADQDQVRRLEMMVGWTRRERLRILWYRLRLTVQEMNYATHRMVGPQTRLL